MVAYHAVVVLPPEAPDGQVTVRVEVREHAVHEVGVALRSDDCVQGMCRAERIPQREGGVIRAAFGHTARRIVGGGVAAVGVADGVRLYHGVVKGSIELLHILLIALRLDTSEHVVPRLVGLRGVAVEAPTCGLALHVQPGVLYACGRQCHLDGKLVAALGVKVEPRLERRSVDNRHLSVVAATVNERARGNRARQLDAEIHTAQLSPARYYAVTLNGVGRHNAELRLYDAAVPACLGRRVVKVYV